jgi:hypothetical protein
LKQLEEIGVASKLGQEIVVISEHAKAQPLPIGPNRKAEITKMALYGLLVALLIIIAISTTSSLMTILFFSCLGNIFLKKIRTNIITAKVT